jgi:hypothetical protein
MTTAELLEPILDNGILSTNFFNGRVLTAEDMGTEQGAVRAHDALLGLAIGDGVVNGLEVSIADDPSGATSPPGRPDATVVRVTRGLAIARTGETIRLSADAVVRLIPAADAQRADAGLFARCGLPSATLTNSGLYVLVIRGASGLTGNAPMVSLNSGGLATRCAKAMIVEGAALRLAPLALDAPGAATPSGNVAKLANDVDSTIAQVASATGSARTALEQQLGKQLSRLRNLAAHLCLGTDALRAIAADPFPDARGNSPHASRGAIDAMRDGRTLDDCEVPIALLAWTRRGVEFIDWWAVRRPVIPGTVARAWAPYVSSRRAAEGLASIWQFQQHVEDLQSSLSPAVLAAFAARDWLKWLPPVGFVPFAAEPEAQAFDVETFFRDVADATPTVVRGGWFAALVRDAAILPPVNLDAREVVQIYRARENSTPDTGTNPRPYVVFATRDTHGPRERDLVARAFRALWLALAKLYRQRALLHPPVSERPTAASQQLSVRVLAFTDAVAATTILAQQFTTLAESRQLATADALEAFDTVRTTLFDTLDGLVPTDRRILLEKFDFWKDLLTAFGATRRAAAEIESTFLGRIVRALLARLREMETRLANGQLLPVAATVTALSSQIDAIVDKAVKDVGTTPDEPPA